MTADQQEKWRRERKGVVEAMDMLDRMAVTLSHEGRRQAKKLADLYRNGVRLPSGQSNMWVLSTPVMLDDKQVKEVEITIETIPNGQITEIVVNFNEYQIGPDGFRLYPVKDEPQS